jgi:alanine dehydrogenase
MCVKDGEKLPIAMGKAVLTNAAWSMLPGGIIGMGIATAAMSAPAIIQQMDVAAGKLNSKKQQFGGNFQESEAQFGALQRGASNMQNARMQATRVMANHARGAQKVY